jgi:hypothetical protein
MRARLLASAAARPSAFGIGKIACPNDATGTDSSADPRARRPESPAACAYRWPTTIRRSILADAEIKSDLGHQTQLVEGQDYLAKHPEPRDLFGPKGPGDSLEPHSGRSAAVNRNVTRRSIDATPAAFCASRS